MAKPASFKPGDPRINRKGAPKREWTWAGELEKAAQEMAQDGKTIKHHVVRSLLREALKGNVVATKEIMNRMDGMPQQETNIDGKLEVTITRES